MSKKILTIGFFAYCLFSSFLFAKDTIIVSVPPQKYFIEQIAKNNFIIKTMMDDDSILPFYKPTAQQYIWTESAIAYFKIGAYDEKKWIKKIKIKNKFIKTFDTTINIKKDPTDINIWLDPVAVKIQAKNILNYLIQVDSKNKDFYKKNYSNFLNKISSLDCQIKTLFKKNKRNHFIVFNPVWGYFAKRYKLKQLEVNADPYSIKKDNIVSIINQINRYSSNILFIPRYYFPQELYKNINSNTKIVIVPVSHLEYDWANNLINIAKMITYQPR